MENRGSSDTGQGRLSFWSELNYVERAMNPGTKIALAQIFLNQPIRNKLASEKNKVTY